VSANEPYFVGHFPNMPLMPGVLLCEAVAQLGCVVVGAAHDRPLEVTEVRRARFRRPVFPGDILELEVEVRDGGPPWQLEGAVRVRAETVAEVEIVLDTPQLPWIHPTAVVARGAELDAGVSVGAYAVLGADVRIGPETWVGPHAVIDGRTTIGARNRIFPFASVGTAPQDLKYHGESSTLTIGDDNTIREFVSVNPGTEGGGLETVVGSGCLFMVNSHVAHDCHLGDFVVLANAAALGGHVTVDSYAIIGGLAGIHQFVRIGESALCAAGAMVSLDVPPFCTVAGDRARLFGLNVIGLKRRGVSEDTLRTLKRAYRMLFHSDGSRAHAVLKTRQAFSTSTEVAALLDFVEGSNRGVSRP